MKRIIMLFAVAVLAAPVLATTLLDNGPWITGYGNGAGGANTSAIETGYNVYGYNDNIALAGYNFMLADDFTVPAGEIWTLDDVLWYGYQTNSGLTSTMTGIYVEIFNGNPKSGGTVLYGDETTNRLLGTYWSGVYRVTQTTLTNTQRPVMENMADMTWVPPLPAGSYWLAVGLTGSLASGPWANPVTPHRDTDNAVQRVTGVWSDVDADSTAGPPVLIQDFPFVLEGTPEPTTLSMLALGALALIRRR